MSANVVTADSLRREVVKVFEKRKSLHRPAGFRRNEEQRLGEIQSLRVRGDGLGIGAVEHGEIEKARPHTKGETKDFRREARAAHAEQQGVREALGAHFVHKRGDFGNGRAHHFRTVQPAQAIGDLSGFGFPDGVIVLPNARENGVIMQILQRIRHRAFIFPQKEMVACLPAAQLLQLVRERIAQPAVCFGECLQTVLHKLLGDDVQVNAQAGQLCELLPGFAAIKGQGRRELAVLEKRGQCHGRHAADGLRRDQILHIEGIGEQRMAHAGVAPQQPLRCGTGGGEFLPARALHDLLELGIDQPG